MARDKKTISRSTYQQSIQSELAYRQAQQQLSESNRHLAESQLRVMQMQINPHFVYNSLNSINYFILEHEAEQASLYLTKFSKLMRQVIANTSTEWVSLRNELNALQIYVELELLRSDNGFNMILDVDESLNPEKLYIPPFVTYPYVENAIRHGLLQPHVDKPTLRINCRQQEGYLQIDIIDNGIGRAASAQAQRNGLTAHKAYGHLITTERLRIVNEINDVGARIDITDLFTSTGDPAGTCVTFTMKLRSARSADAINTTDL